MTVIACIRTETLSKLRTALSGSCDVELAENWVACRRRIFDDDVDLLVLDPLLVGGAIAEFTDMLVELRSLTIVLYPALHSPEARAMWPILAAIAKSRNKTIILHEFQDAPEVLRAQLEHLPYDGMIGAFLALLIKALPRHDQSLEWRLRRIVESPPPVTNITKLRDLFFCDRRSLERACSRIGIRSIHRLALAKVALHAWVLLAVMRRDDQRVAHALGAASATALANRIRQLTGCESLSALAALTETEILKRVLGAVLTKSRATARKKRISPPPPPAASYLPRIWVTQRSDAAEVVSEARMRQRMRHHGTANTRSPRRVISSPS
jgi:hypothetical protein